MKSLPLPPAAAALLVLALVSAACDRKQAPSQSQSPAPSPPASQGQGQPQSQSAASPAESRPKSVAKPRPHDKLLALVDFSQFPKMEGAERQSASAVSLGFSIAKPKDDPAIITRCAEALEKFLTAQGWKSAPEAGGYPWKEDVGGVAFYQKDGAIVQSSVGVSRGYAEGSQIVNAGLFLLGDVDMRSLPQPSGSSKIEGAAGDFSYVRFQCSADLPAIRQFNKDQLAPLGWTEFRAALPGGLTRPMKDLEKEQSFIQNGVTIHYRFTPKGAGAADAAAATAPAAALTEVSVRSQLHTTALPIPPQPETVELQDVPALVSCTVKMNPDQILAWCQQALGEGWTAEPVPATAPGERAAIRHHFTHASKKPLLLECLRASDITIMRLRETTQ